MVPRKYLILLSASGLLVSADQLTKNAVVNSFRLGDSLPVLEGLFNITRVHNTGAAFGIFATAAAEWREPFFFIVPCLTLAVILAVFHKLREDQGFTVYALSLIVGGALGNLADRIRLGFVIDFLDFHWKERWHFPAFNVADSAISVGVAMLLLNMIFDREHEGEEARGAN